MTYLAEGPRMTFFGVEVDYYTREVGEAAVGATDRVRPHLDYGGSGWRVVSHAAKRRTRLTRVPPVDRSYGRPADDLLQRMRDLTGESTSAAPWPSVPC